MRAHPSRREAPVRLDARARVRAGGARRVGRRHRCAERAAGRAAREISRAAVMIVVHLPPDPPSYLVQSFSHRCALPVIEPDAGERILAGRVYVAPPGYHMLVEDDRTVALSTEAAVRFSRPSIDVMFESAAWAVSRAPACHPALGRQRRRRARPRNGARAGRRRLGAGAGNRLVAGNAARRDRARRSGRNSVSFYYGPPSCADCRPLSNKNPDPMP